MKLFSMMMVAMMTCGLRAADPCPVSENIRGHENVEWSVAYAFHLTDANKDLPRVLLVGDSICNGYQGLVQKKLAGKVNVSYWVSSYCLTMPSYRKLLDVYLSEAKYDVIHFNNGLHSLHTDPTAWENSFRDTIAFIRTRQPEAKIVWCSSTPLKDPVRTAKAAELNARADKVVKEMRIPVVNDLFKTLDPLDREQNWSDIYHHKGNLREIEAQLVSDSVLAALGK